MSESNPGIQVYRPILNVDKDAYYQLFREARRRGAKPNQLTTYEKYNTVSLLGSGAVRSLLDDFGIKAGENTFSQLGDYICEHLPPSADEDLAIPTHPHGQHVPVGKSSVWLFTVGRDDPTIRHEVSQTHLLTEEFFDLEEEAGATDWSKGDYKSDVWVAKSRFPRVVEMIKNVFDERPDIFPATIELGPVVVDTHD